MDIKTKFKLVIGIIFIMTLAACGDRNGLETGGKLFTHYCYSCHSVSKETFFLKNIKTSVLTRRSSLTVANTILDDRKHGKKRVNALNELSQKETQKLVKYLYQLKIEYETIGKIKSL